MQLNKHRLSILLCISLLFWGPFLAAWFVFRHPQSFMLHTVNHGQLLQPTVNLTQLGVTSLPIALQNNWQNQWLMIYAPELPCTKICENALAKQRQVWLALHKNREHIQRVVIAASTELDFISWLNHTYRDVILLPVNPIQLQQFTKRLKISESVQPSSWIFIADPAKNIMLYHNADTLIEKNLYDDLMRLLNTSQI